MTWYDNQIEIHKSLLTQLELCKKVSDLSNRIYITCHVVFDESLFLCASDQESSMQRQHESASCIFFFSLSLYS